MAFEEIVVTTPLKRKVKVQMKNLGDDVWDTSLFYANQVRRVGKFKGKDFASATKKAVEIAPPSTGAVICGNPRNLSPVRIKLDQIDDFASLNWPLSIV
jgi:hypothetical protein